MNAVPTRRDNVGDLMVNIFMLVGIILAVIIPAGLIVGVLRRLGWGTSGDAMTVLHLEDHSRQRSKSYQGTAVASGASGVMRPDRDRRLRRIITSVFCFNWNRTQGFSHSLFNSFFHRLRKTASARKAPVFSGLERHSRSEAFFLDLGARLK